MGRFVDFNRNVQDRAARHMIKRRFTTGCVSKYTLLTEGQVNYRRKLLRTWSLADRQGRTAYAKQLLNKIDYLIRECRKLREVIMIYLIRNKPSDDPELQNFAMFDNAHGAALFMWGKAGDEWSFALSGQSYSPMIELCKDSLITTIEKELNKLITPAT
jgi:hypothetical protein